MKTYQNLSLSTNQKFIDMRANELLDIIIVLNQRLLKAGCKFKNINEVERVKLRHDDEYRASMAKIEYERWVKSSVYGKKI